MRRWYRFLLLGVVIGLGVGFSLGLMAHCFGWLGPSQTPLSERPPQTGTAFVEKFSLATAAKEALPGVPWNELWDHKRETSICGADGKSSRNGAIVRLCHPERGQSSHQSEGADRLAPTAVRDDGGGTPSRRR